MPLQPKTLVITSAAAALALGVTACGGSATKEAASSASSMASSASSAVSSTMAAMPAMTDGTLAGVCTEIDSIMLGTPDADPAGTAAKLEAIQQKISTPDADLVGNLAAAYTAIAANPADAAAQDKLKSSASALGAGCEMATTTAKPN